MEIRIEVYGGSNKNIKKTKTLIHWELIKDYAETANLNTKEKILLSESLIDALNKGRPDSP
ncbi:MAG: hypothetical protein IKD83_08145 [Firmicutes bacterium]|nr:hypothetical protein [Bacillota bacterium]